MKTLARVLMVAALLSMLALTFVSAGQLAVPMEKKILPGSPVVVTYAGQNLRFSTPTAIVIRLEPLTETQIRLTVRPYGSAGGAQGASSQNDLIIYWEDFGTNVYTGPPPEEEWTGILLTESGFTEK